MARAVGNIADQALARPAGIRNKFVHQRANSTHHCDIFALAISADIVAFADAPALSDQEERACMILNIKPVAHVLALAIDRQWFALERIENDQRNKLFRKMTRAKI